jgi:hypothetical protein
LVVCPQLAAAKAEENNEEKFAKTKIHGVTLLCNEKKEWADSGG